MRLDSFLASSMPDHSRTRIQGLIQDGFVSVNNRLVIKPSSALQSGDHIQVSIPPAQPSTLLPEEIPLDILFENNDLLVINKPAGLVVHPSAGHDTGTLVNAVLSHAPHIEGIGGEIRPGVVHRLDKETSGIILLAKNDQAHRWLQDQFRLRKVKKVYITLVDGRPPTSAGRVEAPIGRDPVQRKKMAVLPLGRGREAVTEYHVIHQFTLHTLIEAHPITGRTHQIRLHMAFIGCPVVGDRVYGHKKNSLQISRHFLHATRLEICLPGENKPRLFEATLPEDLQSIVNQLMKSHFER